MDKRYHLFQGYGIELEYMIVDKQSLKVMPVSDMLLKKVLGDIGTDYVNGRISWSNELVLHVLELKTTVPEADLTGLNDLFHSNVKMVNELLAEDNAMLLPTAMHPLMNPALETRIWPHDYNAVYEAYNKMFNCKGHGWSNVQSMHINLPFYDDEEFSRLHDAIRIILPLIPALAASSPVVEGKVADHIDQRLAFYKQNQASIPVIAGHIIPEMVHSKRQYHQQIYREIKNAIAPFDKENILDPVWVNSRGAIARFDRGSIEIRLIDIQENPQADLAIAAFVIELVKWLYRNDCSVNLKASQLAKILSKTIKHGQKVLIDDLEYLNSFGITNELSAGELLNHLYIKVKDTIPTLYQKPLQEILLHGTLAERILSRLNADPGKEQITELYQELSECLAKNEMLLGSPKFV